MEDVIPIPVGEWLETARPLRTNRKRAVESYLRSPDKDLKCKYDYCRAVTRSKTRQTIHAASHRRQDALSDWLVSAYFADDFVLATPLEDAQSNVFVIEAPHHGHEVFSQWLAKTCVEDALVLELADSTVNVEDAVVRRAKAESTFSRLADEWESDVRSVSSLSAMVSHPNYQQIIALGWDVVPALLTDLRLKRRFWLPALKAITGIQPFDASDEGNSKKMINAWVQWGKLRHFIE